MAKKVIVTAEKIKKRKNLFRFLKVGIIGSMTAMTSLFIVLNIVYNGGKFSINLDKDLAEKKGIVLYENSETKLTTRKLYAEDIEYMDNISINWIPKNIHDEKDGAHNGKNYIAYTFYIENQGEEVVDYWYTIYIDDVIKNVDEATRIMIYKNEEKEVYAKLNADNEPEKDTKAFFSNEIAVIEKREGLKPTEFDKFTIVIWLEGDDPDCVNKIIGGEIKLHMEINEERI
ncbi:MAG: hypothetical protein E7170_00025 [Firmicutes bacterium]|nr:hypothetical protein [Bacillota bacterium]